MEDMVDMEEMVVVEKEAEVCCVYICWVCLRCLSYIISNLICQSFAFFRLGGGGACGNPFVSPPACNYFCQGGNPVCKNDDEEDSADYDYDEGEDSAASTDYYDEDEDSASADQYYAEE